MSEWTKTHNSAELFAAQEEVRDFFEQFGIDSHFGKFFVLQCVNGKAVRDVWGEALPASVVQVITVPESASNASGASKRLPLEFLLGPSGRSGGREHAPHLGQEAPAGHDKKGCTSRLRRQFKPHRHRHRRLWNPIAWRPRTLCFFTGWPRKRSSLLGKTGTSPEIWRRGAHASKGCASVSTSSCAPQPVRDVWRWYASVT